MQTERLMAEIDKGMGRALAVEIPTGSPDWLWWIHRVSKAVTENDVLTEALVAEPVLSCFGDQRMLILRNAGRRAAHVDVARWLVKRAGEVGSTQALGDLDRFLVDDRFDVLDVVAIVGIEVRERIDLGDGLSCDRFKKLVRCIKSVGLSGSGTVRCWRAAGSGSREVAPREGSCVFRCPHEEE